MHCKKMYHFLQIFLTYHTVLEECTVYKKKCSLFKHFSQVLNTSFKRQQEETEKKCYIPVFPVCSVKKMLIFRIIFLIILDSTRW